MEMDASRLANGYGLPTISIALGEQPVAGETYQVQVVDGANSWTYRTTFVTCPLHSWTFVNRSHKDATLHYPQRSGWARSRLCDGWLVPEWTPRAGAPS